MFCPSTWRVFPGVTEGPGGISFVGPMTYPYFPAEFASLISDLIGHWSFPSTLEGGWGRSHLLRYPRHPAPFFWSSETWGERMPCLCLCLTGRATPGIEGLEICLVSLPTVSGAELACNSYGNRGLKWSACPGAQIDYLRLPRSSQCTIWF